ncbi:MAG TPA: iron-sulfur cluster repair di-iron protein [Geobacteraceae bacterium]
MDSLLERHVKDLVTDDHRAAAVFEKYSIDFCCGGKKSLQAACAERGIDAEPVLKELQDLAAKSIKESTPFARWELDALTDHIVERHHSYVREAIPVLLAHTQKIAQVHGGNHPELSSVAAYFQEIARELAHHMMKEERVLFPYIKSLALVARGRAAFTAPPFGTIRNPIRMMEAEHQAAGNGLYAIREATAEYVAPPDACTTYQVTLKELREFEEDLHQHVHLENNILFPKAVDLESGLLSR